MSVSLSALPASALPFGSCTSSASVPGGSQVLENLLCILNDENEAFSS